MIKYVIGQQTPDCSLDTLMASAKPGARSLGAGRQKNTRLPPLDVKHDKIYSRVQTALARAWNRTVDGGHSTWQCSRQAAPIRLTDSPPPASPSPPPAAQAPRTACAGRSSARPPTRR